MPDILRLRLELVTEFSRRALQHDAMPGLVQLACEQVRRGVEASFVKVLQCRAGEDFLLVAGVGFDPADYGTATIPAGPRSVASYVVENREPLRIDDLRSQSTFEWPAALQKYGIVSSLTCPVVLDSEVYGGLEVDSARPTRWTDDEVHFLYTFANVLGAAIHRSRIEEGRTRLLKERAVLLLELQHRVKNHIQLVSTLLNLQESQAQHAEVKSALSVARHRMSAIASTYSNLYEPGATIDLGRHLKQLLSSIQTALASDQTRVEVDAANIEAKADLAIPVSLIATELLTNALKHVAQNGPGAAAVHFSLSRVGDEISIVVRNPGLLPQDFHVEAHSGLGLKIVDQLAQQVGGTLRFERQPVAFKVTIPLESSS